MIFANDSSDALLKADPYIELGIGALSFLGGGLLCLDCYLQNRENKTNWTRKQIQRCMIPIGVGLVFMLFYFLPHN